MKPRVLAGEAGTGAMPAFQSRYSFAIEAVSATVAKSRVFWPRWGPLDDAQGKTTASILGRGNRLDRSGPYSSARRRISLAGGHPRPGRGARPAPAPPHG